MTVVRNNDKHGHVDLNGGDHTYFKRVSILTDRNKLLQQQNQALLHRIYQVKKLTRRYKREIKFLMNRLDMHGDPFRNIKEEEDVKPDLSRLNAEMHNKREKSSSSISNRSNHDRSSSGSNRKNLTPKNKNSKPEKKKTQTRQRNNLAGRGFNFTKGKNSWP